MALGETRGDELDDFVSSVQFGKRRLFGLEVRVASFEGLLGNEVKLLQGKIYRRASFDVLDAPYQIRSPQLGISLVNNKIHPNII